MVLKRLLNRAMLKAGNLGNMHENGKGVTQDYSEALTWFQKAAEQGNAQGQSTPGEHV